MADAVQNFTQVTETVSTTRPLGDIDAMYAEIEACDMRKNELVSLIVRARAAGAKRRSELTPEERAQVDAANPDALI